MKFGGDALYAPVTEALQYQITDPSYFDPGTPPTFNFYSHAPDREQPVWAQDNFHFKNLSMSAGLRWDKLNVINFAGLFSGTAVGTPHSANIQLQFEFCASKRRCSRFRHRVILITRSAAYADCAHHLAIALQRYSAGENHYPAMVGNMNPEKLPA